MGDRPRINRYRATPWYILAGISSSKTTETALEGMPQINKMLVIGGGIAGMCAAIELRKYGVEVDLIEIDPAWGVYGTGISITGPTFRAAQRLGFIEDLISRGFASHSGVRICAANGQLIAQIPAQPIAPGLPTGGGIMRPVLHEILSNKVRASGARVRLGVTLKNLSDLLTNVQVETSDGETNQYALVIAADGTFSSTRKLLFPGAASPTYTGQYCWRLVAERPAEIDGIHFYMAGPITAGLMPTSQTEMYMFLLQAEPVRVRIDETNQWQRLKQLMSPFSGILGQLRDGLSDASRIVCRPLEALLLPRPWHRGRVVLIGDALHATTPHLASGAGIAMEDALVLCQELARNSDILQALMRFEERRWERCRLVVENSVRIGQMEQTHADPVALKALMAESEAALRADI
jgi:2-polyprenyl-6-methoxyphenol hydroxylase-like FAD-dependent oxidoreductase